MFQSTVELTKGTTGHAADLRRIVVGGGGGGGGAPTSATAFVDYVSARRSTHRACYHRRPSLPGGCCICLEQSAGDSTFVAVTASFPQETED